MAVLLRDYKIVKEFGEGVDRMYREMKEAGQPEPKYVQDDFILKATLQAKSLPNAERETTAEKTKEKPKKSQRNNSKKPENYQENIIQLIQEDPSITVIRLAKLLKKTPDSVRYQLRNLTTHGIIKHEGPTKAGKWIILKPI